MKLNTRLLFISLWIFGASRVSSVPTITRQPSPATNSVSLGANFSNRIAATGDASTLIYQWRRNGVDLPGQTNATLSLTTIQVADAGSYTALAIDASGSTESKPWAVDVDTAFTKIISGPVVKALNGTAAALG